MNGEKYEKGGALLKKILSILLVFLLVGMTSGCSLIEKLKKPSYPKEAEVETPEDPNYPVVIGEVEILERPEQVVSLSASLVEQIYDLEMEEALVGVPSQMSYPPQGAELFPCGSVLLPDVEEIIALGADLVLTQTSLPEEVALELEDRGILLIEIPAAENLDQLWENYETLGLILGGKEDGVAQAEEIIGNATGWLDEFFAAAKKQESLSVLYLRHLPATVATGDTLVGQFFSEMGLDYVGKEDSNWTISSDRLLEAEVREEFQQLDAFFIDGEDVTIQDLEGDDFYRVLSVVLNDDYHIMDPQIFEAQGFRMFSQLEEMAEFLWPEATFPHWEAGRSYESGDSLEEPEEEELEIPLDDELLDPIE